MDSLDNSYLYDGSFYGFLSVVFAIYDSKMLPTTITTSENFQLTLDANAIEIETNVTHAARVEKGIRKRAGKFVLDEITKSFLSYDSKKEIVIFNFIQLALKYGRSAMYKRAHPDVIAFEKILLHLGKETQNWRGFLRFSEMEGGFFYAKFAPKNNVTPLLMPHFVSRLADQPFLIHDTTRHIVGVYDLKEWQLIETNTLSLPGYNENEYKYRQMWKVFFETVAIPGRKNKKCQQNHMPHWYRANMTEFLGDEATRSLK